MKTNKFWSILLCLVMLTTTGAFLTSCDNENSPSTNENSPSTSSSSSNSDDDDSNSDKNGGNNGDNNDADAVPDAPTGVTATTQGPKKYPYVRIEWNYVSTVDHWDVYRSKSESGSYSKIGSNISYSYHDESVSYNTTYYYKVKAVNKNGKASEFSDSAAAYVEYYSE